MIGIKIKMFKEITFGHPSSTYDYSIINNNYYDIYILVNIIIKKYIFIFGNLIVQSTLLTLLSNLQTTENMSPPNRLASQRFLIMANLKQSHTNSASILV